MIIWTYFFDVIRGFNHQRSSIQNKFRHYLKRLVKNVLMKNPPRWASFFAYFVAQLSPFIQNAICFFLIRGVEVNEIVINNFTIFNIISYGLVFEILTLDQVFHGIYSKTVYFFLLEPKLEYILRNESLKRKFALKDFTWILNKKKRKTFISFRTAGHLKFKSGCSGKNWWRYHALRDST